MPHQQQNLTEEELLQVILEHISLAGKSEDSETRDNDFAVTDVAGFTLCLGKQKICFQDYHKNISLGCTKSVHVYLN